MGTSSELTRIDFAFDGHAVPVYLFRGRPCWIAQQVGEALQYTPDGFRAALGNWADELIEGKDLDVLTGNDLREFKALLDPRVKLTLGRASHLTILYESGLNVVALLTEKPTGRRLRRFMADEVMPKLARGEPIAPGPVAASLTLTQDQIAALGAEVGKYLEAHGVNTGATIGPVGGREILRSLREYADLMSPPGDRKARRSWRGSGDTELRSRLGFTGTGAQWSELPFGLLPSARRILQEMLNRARQCFQQKQPRWW